MYKSLTRYFRRQCTNDEEVQTKIKQISQARISGNNAIITIIFVTLEKWICGNTASYDRYTLQYIFRKTPAFSLNI